MLRWLRRTLADRRTALAVVLCTALGMAATAAVVTLLDLALRPQAAFPEPDRLVRVWNSEVGSDARDELSWLDYRDLQAHVPAFTAVEAVARARLVWHLPERAGRRVEGEAVTPGYFHTLGVRPMIGRSFSAQEVATGAPVMLISHASWGAEFGYAEDILGRVVSTSTQNQGIRTQYTIVGVLPPDFGGTVEDDMPDLEYWVPAASYLVPAMLEQRQLRSTLVIARLADGASIGQAREHVDALSERLAPEFAGFDPEQRFLVEPFGANWSAPYRAVSPLLAVAVALLMGIAAFNVFLLLLSRTLERAPELAMRAAIGASRGRLLREVGLQGVVLTALGGALGIVLAPMLLEFVLAIGDLRLPEYVSAWPSPPALLLAFVVLVVIALLASLLPAAQVLRRDPAAAMAGGARNVGGPASRTRWQRALVALQLGLATALLAGAATLGESWLALDRSDLGFATENRLRMGLFVNPEDVPETADLPAFVDRVDARLRAVPGVRGVAWVWPTVPIVDAVPVPLEHPAFADAGGEPRLNAGGYVVDAGFFEALEIPMLAGRDFRAGDDAAAEPVAIVGAALAERLGGVQRALNQPLRMADGRAFRVVGVVGDTRFGGAAERAGHDYELYLHYDQAPRRVFSPVVHVAGDPDDHAAALTRALAEAAPGSAVDWVDPVDRFAGWLIRDERFRFLLVGLFSGSALLLAAAGLYGLMSQQVVRRTREIGLRKALGARDGSIVLRILIGAASVVVAGLALGALLSVALAGLMRGAMPGVSGIGAGAIAAAMAVLGLVALLAGLVPSLRAARVAPMQALRHD